ncbi:MAG: TonB-dependent receptor [bacterium]
MALACSTLARGEAGFDEAAPSSTRYAEQLFLEAIPEVYAASKRPEPTTDAPSAVTIITAEEIRRHGYRTLGQILRSVPGFFTSYDRVYTHVGVRGFLPPGDYTSRLLFLVDGHRINDGVWGAAPVGDEFPVDVHQIDRVEVVPGPSASLYGTNAFFGVVNVITRRGRDVQGISAGGGIGSQSTYDARATAGARWAGGAELLATGAYASSAGDPHLFVPDLVGYQSSDGVARDADDGRALDLFGKGSFAGIQAMAGHGTRTKTVPTAPFGSAFPSDRTTTEDAFTWADVSMTPELSPAWQLSARVFFDQFDHTADGWLGIEWPFTGRTYHVTNRNWARAQSLGSEVAVETTALDRNRIMLGATTTWYLDQRTRDSLVEIHRELQDSDREPWIWSAYAQDKLAILPTLALHASLRYDSDDTVSGRLSPRAALVFTPLEETTLKAIYGQAFRAPSAFEIAAPRAPGSRALAAETIDSYELVVEQSIGSALRLVGSGYYYQLHDLITLQPPKSFGPPTFANSADSDAMGASLAIDGRWPGGWRVRGSYSIQRIEDEATHDSPPNSPTHLGKVLAGAPLVDERLTLNGELEVVSSRKTLAGATTDTLALFDLTLRAEDLVPELGVGFTVRNVFDQRYAEPAGVELPEDSVPQDGRTYWLELDYTLGL